jgi:hypothetical protein
MLPRSKHLFGVRTLEPLLAYLAGEPLSEKAAFERLRGLGSAAARACGFSGHDANEVGVDFAACLIAGEWTTLTLPARGEPDLRARVRLAAHWYALRAWRVRRRIADAELTLERGAEIDVPPQLSDAEDSIAVATAWIAGRPAGDRQLYEVCIIQGKDCHAAADALGCTPAAARKRLERLRRQLRALLKESE